MLKKVKHHNIIQYIEDGEVDGQWCIILELGGVNLCQYLEAEETHKLNPGKAVCVFKDILAGVSTLHVSSFLTLYLPSDFELIY